MTVPLSPRTITPSRCRPMSQSTSRRSFSVFLPALTLFLCLAAGAAALTPTDTFSPTDSPTLTPPASSTLSPTATPTQSASPTPSPVDTQTPLPTPTVPAPPATVVAVPGDARVTLHWEVPWSSLNNGEVFNV